MVIGVDASRAFVKDPAGPEYYSLNLIKNLAKIDKHNRYILYLRPGQKANFRLPHNFEAKIINFPFLWTQIGLAAETLLKPPAVIFVPAHTLPLLTRIFRPRLPIVVTIHGLEGKYLPQSGNLLAHIYRNWSIGWAVKFAHRLIAVSEDTQKDILKTYQIDAKKIQVIHEGVDEGQFSKTTGQNIHYRFKTFILFVGTIQPRKNLIRLIKAFSMLPQKDLGLVIAGKLGWLYGKILESPKRFGVEDRVVFLGRVSDSELPGLYKKAKVFVIPSLTEGFGLPILEAQAAGVPVVASKKGALPEVAGKGALFVNPKSVKSIRSGLMRAFVPKVRQDLIRKGKENLGRFSWKKTAYNTLNFLEKLKAGP
ncbi:glycosyl transferase family 1 [Candidatus Woesebacteria bacterium]|nr:glycosyl transferase family 1 [Candidatus Woesebacteria bacterium]